MWRWFVMATATLMVAGCTGSQSEPERVASMPTATGAPVSTPMVTDSSSPGTSTTIPAQSTTSTTTMPSPGRLILGFAPADGQCFAEPDLPWIWGDTRPKAVVTVNGLPTSERDPDSGRWVFENPNQPIDEARRSPLVLEDGENTLVIEATFPNGTTDRQERRVYYDPALESVTGWMVDLDPEERTVTFAAATMEPADDDGMNIGEVTSVAEYSIRDDAAFILLGEDSYGQPPPSVIDSDAFVELILKATSGGCRGDCFFASSSDHLSPPDEPGYPYGLLLTTEGQIQQLEQIWTP